MVRLVPEQREGHASESVTSASCSHEPEYQHRSDAESDIDDPVGDHHRRQTSLLMDDDAGGDAPGREHETVDGHTADVACEHHVLQAEEHSLDQDGGRDSGAPDQAFLEPTAVDDLLDRTVREEDDCTEDAHRWQHAGGQLRAGFGEYLFKILEHVCAEYEIHRPHQGDDHRDIGDEQPQESPGDVLAETTLLETKICPCRHAVPPERTPDNGAADDIDEGKIERVERWKILTDASESEYKICCGRQCRHGDQTNEYEVEWLVALRVEWIFRGWDH